MKEHTGILSSLAALIIIVAAALTITLHGAKDETLLAILFTGAVGIANTIAGVKSNAPLPSTTTTTATSIADPPAVAPPAANPIPPQEGNPK